MGRRPVREARRREIVAAYARVLARQGLGAASIAAVAREAGVAPGLIHHHFRDRDDLADELVRHLARRFRGRVPLRGDDPAAWIAAYVDAALEVRDEAGVEAARAWVGVFAEAVRTESVGTLVRRALDAEHRRLRAALEALGHPPDEAAQRAAAVVSGVIGALVFGAFVPEAAPGFAARAVRRAALGGDP